ncbi:unnamed protein product [Orchesella dallaii]|uniref:Uncharacterized protein n=1 Tax=Orchesella dallaii TaxID=48710 RepID=A0ABP1R4Y4_9HEXA
MSSVQGETKKMKGHEDEMVLFKQFMTARESSHLLNKTRLDVRLFHENITDQELLDFTNQEIKWIDLATEFRDRIVKPDLENQSFPMFEEWKIVRDMYGVVKRGKEDFLQRLNDAIIEFKKKEAQLSDPGVVDQFGFCQTMSTKQRKKFLKECIAKDNIALGEMTKFQTLKEEWEALKTDMQCCIEQLEQVSGNPSQSSL